MVGRTPEYLGKKIGRREMTLVALYILRCRRWSCVGAGDRRWRCPAATPRCSTRPARAVRGALRLHLGGEQQRLGVRRALGRTRPSTTSRSGWRCCSAGSCRSSWCWPWPARSPGSAPVPATAGTLPTHRPLFVGLLVGVVLVVAGLTFFPALALGPLAEALLTTLSPRRRRRTSAASAAARPGSCCVAAGRPAQARPAHLWRNPVMFVVWVGRCCTTVLAVADPQRVRWSIAVWLWLTVAVRQPRRGGRRGPRQGPGRPLRAAKTETVARRLRGRRRHRVRGARRPQLRLGDLVVVEAGAGDPRRRRRRRGRRQRRRVGDHRRVGAGDPRVRRRPVARSPAAPRCCRTGSSCRSPPSRARRFLDRMIALVEGAARQKTPNEIALNILLAGLTHRLPARRGHAAAVRDLLRRSAQPLVVLVALLVCLIPTTIGALLSAIGIAGMDRLVQRNVLAMSGRAVEAAGDVDDAAAGQDRHHHPRQPAGRGVHARGRRADAPSSPTRRSWPAWPTRPRRAARSSCSPRTRYGLRGADPSQLAARDVRRRSPRRPG